MAPTRARMAAVVLAFSLSLFPFCVSASLNPILEQVPTLSTHATPLPTPTPPPSDHVRLILARQAGSASTSAPAAASTTASSSVDDFPSYSYMSTPPAVPTARDDNGLGLDGALGVSSGSGDNAGASGQDQGSSGISTGGIIGLSVGLFVVIVAAGIVWYLWYQAKKSSWAAVRRSIRTASRRVTDSIRPMTGRSARFPASARGPFPGVIPSDRDAEGSKYSHQQQRQYYSQQRSGVSGGAGQKTFLQSPAPAKKKRSNHKGEDGTDRSGMSDSDAGQSFGSDLEKGPKDYAG